MKTKAAILTELKRPLVIDEIEIPELYIGQVLVKIRMTRICGSQIGEIDGVKGPDRFIPHLLGHEASGEVLEIGAGVKTVKPGDRVCCHWRPGEGLVGDPPKYKWATKTVNAGWIATFSDYAVISENRLTVVPKELDENFVALLADTITTGFGIVNNDAELKIGESFVIFGAGGIGMGAILGAKLAGAYPIIAVDLFDHKLEIAKKIGAHFIVNANDPHHVEQIENILNGKADVVAEGTGNPTVIEKCYSLTNPQGRTVLYGVMSHDKRVSIHTLPLHFGKVLTGSVGGSSLPTVEIPRYVKMFQNNIFEVNDFVSHTGQLDEVNELITKMRSGEVLHAMLDLR